MLELGKAVAPAIGSTFVSFSETGLCRPFLDAVGREGFDAVALRHDTPRLAAAARELEAVLRAGKADVLCCHGYKADLLGLVAARRSGIPVIAVSRGWTAETARVRFYEALDRRVLARMDRVVCVSEAQAERVRRVGVLASKVVVIRNAIRVERFERPVDGYRSRLQGLFRSPRRWIVGAAGRLSPEKGFAFLVDAAAEVLARTPEAGFVVFGEGALRDSLERRIAARRLEGRFALAGFRPDFDAYVPHLDLLVLSSLTEGLPNVAIEALAAGVPVVATNVGGTGEAVSDGEDGVLVPPGDPHALAKAICELLAADEVRCRMGIVGRRRMRRQFSFAAQAAGYRRLFAQLGVGRLGEEPQGGNGWGAWQVSGRAARGQ